MIRTELIESIGDLNGRQASERPDAVAFVDQAERIGGDDPRRFTGRLKEIIIRGGHQNIPPVEVEDVVVSHRSVADCSVVGIEHEFSGEVPVAFVVSTNERSSMQRSCSITAGHWFQLTSCHR